MAHDPAARATSGALAGTTDLDLLSCAACGQVAEVTGHFAMPGLEGSEPYIRTRCLGGHLFVGPEFALRSS